MKIEECKQLSEAILTIDSATTRQQAYEALSSLKLAQLKAIAKHYDVFINKVNKRSIIEKIIEFTVGNRLKSEALKTLNLH